MNLINLDISIILFLQSHLNDFLIKYLEFIANFADETLVVIIVGFFYWGIDKKFGMKLAINICLANVAYPMIKNIVCRIRPYMLYSDVKCIKQTYEGDPNSIEVQGYSFPSGHSTTALMIYGPMFNKYKNIIIKVLTAIVIISVCISRASLGTHYPSDVVGGLVLAIIIMKIYGYLIKKFPINKVNVCLLLVSIIGFFYCESNDFYTGYGLFVGVTFGKIFEERYVNFKNTDNILEMIIRMILGLAVFFVFYVGLKLPFSSEFLGSKTFLAHLVRTIRYAITVFIGIGIYPMCFKYLKLKKK